jgi:hypothetical protein
VPVSPRALRQSPFQCLGTHKALHFICSSESPARVRSLLRGVRRHRREPAAAARRPQRRDPDRRPDRPNLHGGPDGRPGPPPLRARRTGGRNLPSKPSLKPPSCAPSNGLPLGSTTGERGSTSPPPSRRSRTGATAKTNARPCAASRLETGGVFAFMEYFPISPLFKEVAGVLWFRWMCSR